MSLTTESASSLLALSGGAISLLTGSAITWFYHAKLSERAGYFLTAIVQLALIVTGSFLYAIAVGAAGLSTGDQFTRGVVLFGLYAISGLMWFILAGCLVYRKDSAPWVVVAMLTVILVGGKRFLSRGLRIDIESITFRQFRHSHCGAH